MNNETNNIKNYTNKINGIINNKKILRILFLVFGVIFVITLLLGIKNTIDYVQKMHSSEALIVSITDNNNKLLGKHSYDIEFFDNNDNTCKSQFNSNKKYDIDDQIMVYYNSCNKVYLHRDNPYILVISVISLIICTILLLLMREKKVNIHKKNKRLLKSKLKIEAKINNVIRSDKNNTKYYSIVCSWMDPVSNREYTFNSEDLDFDPTITINILHKSSLDVYLDKNDYNKYYVDVSEIKKNKI